MYSQPVYCFLAELTVFPVNEDDLSVHVITSQKQGALLFMFLEFYLSSFVFLNFERGIICSQTWPPHLSKTFDLNLSPALLTTSLCPSLHETFLFSLRIAPHILHKHVLASTFTAA